MTGPSPRELAGSAAQALLTQAEAERTEVEEVLIDLAGALAEDDPGRLVHRLLDATRRVAAASFGLFLPEDGGPPAFVSGEDHIAFKEVPIVRQAPLLAAAVEGSDVLVVDDLLRWARSDDARGPYGSFEGGGVVRSWLVVPMRDEAGLRHGAMVLGHPEPHRFDHRRERLAAGVGQHLARALARVDAERERDRVARVLQETLLPPVMPQVPGVDVAARYRAAGAANVVGGDFYDVFEVGGDGWAVVLGDVSGVGPEAAAITGQARYTVRAVARDEPTPSGVLRRLNDAVGGRVDDRFLTAVFLRLQPAGTSSCGIEVTLSRGGHPPPLLLRDGGRVESLDGAAGLPLGMFADAEVSDLGCRLSPGDAIVLYTDGVIEARNGAGHQFGQERLAALLATCAGRTADGIARRIELAAMDFQGESPGDDVAIVVARAHPNGGLAPPPG